MPSRYYFSFYDQPAITPAASAGWEQLPSPLLRGVLKPQPEARVFSTNNLPQTPAKTGAATAWDIFGIQYISKGLPTAGTLSGTFDLVLATRAILSGYMLQCIIRVVDSTGTIVRGTAYAGQSNTGVVATAGAVNQEIGYTHSGITAGIRIMPAQALTNTAYQAGDRIVVELGARCTVTGTGNIVNLYAHDNEDLSIAYADLTKYASNLPDPMKTRSWIEFSQDLWTAPAAEEFKFMDEGTLLNSSPSLPFVDVTSIDGLDSTSVRMQSHDREGIHGGYVSSEFESSRTITVEGFIYATPSTLETYLDQLKQNFAPTRRDRKFYFGTDTGTRMVFGKSQGIRYAKDSQRRLGVVAFQVQIACQDPRLYSTTETVVTGTSNVSPATGLYGTFSGSGNRETPGLIRVFGPTTTLSLSLQNRYGYFFIQYSTAISSTDVFMVDLDKRTVVLNHLTNVRGACTVFGDWIPISSEGNRYSFIHTGSAYTWSLTYRPAWR